MRARAWTLLVGSLFIAACTALPSGTPPGASQGGGMVVTPAWVDTRVTPSLRATLPVAADLVLRAEDNGETFTLHPAQTLAIVLEFGASWEAAYDANVLQLQVHQ